MIGDVIVVAGPEEIGNTFGYSGHFVPEGRWAACCIEEYVDGGVGPSTIDGVLYRSAEKAEVAAEAYRRKKT